MSGIALKEPLEALELPLSSRCDAEGVGDSKIKVAACFLKQPQMDCLALHRAWVHALRCCCPPSAANAWEVGCLAATSERKLQNLAGLISL